MGYLRHNEKSFVPFPTSEFDGPPPWPGYRKKDPGKGLDLFLFTPEAFNAALGSADRSAVLDKLLGRGYLHTNNVGKDKPKKACQFSVPGKPGKVSFYGIKASILNSEDDDSQEGSAES